MMQAQFRIERIDTERGQAIVTFIDPHGNEDQTLAVDLPVTDTGFAAPDVVEEHIGKHFPLDHFDALNARKAARGSEALMAIEGKTVTIQIEARARKDVMARKAEPAETVTV